LARRGCADHTNQGYLSTAGFEPAKAREQNFAKSAAGYKTGVYRWWFGPAQTEAELACELDVSRHAGIGYVLIFPLCPMSSDDPAKGIRNFRYLSPEFLEAVGCADGKATEPGIEVDILLGTGRPYGGPSITY
jgi:hypothetical protein